MLADLGFFVLADLGFFGLERMSRECHVTN